MPEFKEQVDWEFRALGDSDILIFNFLTDSVSLITMMKLGEQCCRLTHFYSPKIYVICPEAFWRSGNVKHLCQRWRVPVFETEQEFFETFIKENE